MNKPIMPKLHFNELNHPFIFSIATQFSESFLAYSLTNLCFTISFFNEFPFTLSNSDAAASSAFN